MGIIRVETAYLATSRHLTKCLKSTETEQQTHTEKNSVLTHYQDWGAHYLTCSAEWFT